MGHCLILDSGLDIFLKGLDISWIVDFIYFQKDVFMYLNVLENLLLVAKLDELGFYVKIGNNVFSLFKDIYCYESCTSINGLYCFNLDVKFIESLFNVEYVLGSKRNVLDNNSAYLWHQRLGHISKKRIMRLMKNDILPQLDFDNWDVCLDYIKGTQTKQISKNYGTRSNHLNVEGYIDAD